MTYRHLGRAGVRVSTLALGSWLTYGQAVDRDRTEACVRRAYELGINFFDTANAYGRGAAEEVLGSILRQFPRESYVLATKVYFPMGEGPNDRGLSRKHIMEQCHASLRRLGVEYIDLYQCHRFDPETPLEETLRALDDLVRQGKVLYVGVSEWTAAQITEALHLAREMGLDRIVSNQPSYNMLNRYIEPEIMPLCGREGVGLIAFSPLAQGVLTGKYRAGSPPPAGSRAADPQSNYWIRGLLTPEVLNRVEALRPIAQRYGLTLAQLALAWVLRRPEMTSAIIGATRPEQVEENVKAASVVLPPEAWEDVEKVLQGKAEEH